ncbi:MAG: hypothetical protein H7Z41_01850 [Cytophagales bacterium]|nr:hypothetical protein [Armatimonadota bacterium]
MIFLVVTYVHSDTVRGFLQTWGRSLQPRLKLLFYEDLFCRWSLPRGAYIFSDLERLTPQQLRQAETVAGYLVEQGCPVLNRPARALRRYPLLRMLHASGINHFRVSWLQDGCSDLRFPVFLRREDEHDGPISPLIRSEAELREQAATATRAGAPPDKLLIVEFCDTADDSGTYRKYSAFLIGGRLLPRHVLFSGNWVQKYPDLVAEPQAREEREYLFADPHPHEERVRDIFRRAAIDYGRIDYGLMGDRIQVWEINTNPTITAPRERLAPTRLAAQAEVAARLCAAFAEIGDLAISQRGIALPVTNQMRQRLGTSFLAQCKRPLRQLLRPLRARIRNILHQRPFG